MVKINPKLLLNAVYPVGSIYMSVNSTNPTNIFGGTWEQLKDRFLLGAGNTYSNGATGGEATHKLTIQEMPSHQHPVNLTGEQQTGEAVFTWQGGQLTRQYSGNDLARFTGGDQPHNNMPPYLVVYIWKRTA